MQGEGGIAATNVPSFAPEMKRARFLGLDFSAPIKNWLYNITPIQGKEKPFVAGTYKKWAIENGVKYFSVASGGGTGRTLHPDNAAAGPASYGMTDTMGRMHGDAQFAGSSSVPAHVEKMGLIGAGNNPMVGMSVAVAVACEVAMK